MLYISNILINLIRSYLASKEEELPKEESLKSIASIVVEREIAQISSQIIAEIESKVKRPPAQGYSKKSYEYLLKRGLNYGNLKLLIPQLENSIGGAKGLLSVLPEVVYDAKEKKFFMWNGEIWQNVPDSHFKKIYVNLLERQYDLASLCGLLNKDMIDNGSV